MKINPASLNFFDAQLCSYQKHEEKLIEKTFIGFSQKNIWSYLLLQGNSLGHLIVHPASLNFFDAQPIYVFTATDVPIWSLENIPGKNLMWAGFRETVLQGQTE